MDWTWSLDRYAAGALALGSLGILLAAFLWWVWGGLRLLRRGAVRAALLLPYGLAWGVGAGRQPVATLLFFIFWLSLEVSVPRVRTALRGTARALDATAASAASCGAVACLGTLWLGPLPARPAAAVSVVGGGLALIAGMVGATVSAMLLWSRVFVSPVSRALAAAGLVLAVDCLFVTEGGWTVLFLGLPLLVQLGLGLAAALRRHWAASLPRVAAAAVWFLALSGLVAFSRFNLHLAERRSADVIAACRGYEADHGSLPPTLEYLVPAYLPEVPRASWTTRGGFRYRGGDGPALSYYAPWPREVVYSFETGERQVRPAGRREDPAEETLRARRHDGRQLRADARGGDPFRHLSPE